MLKLGNIIQNLQLIVQTNPTTPKREVSWQIFIPLTVVIHKTCNELGSDFAGP